MRSIPPILLRIGYSLTVIGLIVGLSSVLGLPPGKALYVGLMSCATMIAVKELLTLQDK